MERYLIEKIRKNAKAERTKVYRRRPGDTVVTGKPSQ